MRRIFLISVALLWGATLASATPAGGVLKGVVLNSRNQPVAAAQVFLQSADGTAPRILRTDAQGHFRMPYLHAGLYDVRAEAAGNWSPWSHNVVLKSGKEAEVTLKLNRRSPPTTPK